MSGIIYALVDPRTGSPRYVGLTRRTPTARLNAHWLSRASKTHRGAWLRRAGKPEIVVLARVPEAALSEFERFWIAEMQRRGFHLTNGTDGGEEGFVHTERTRKLISEKKKGRTTRTGMPHSPETKAKIAAARKGQRNSEAAKAKMSAAKKGKPKSPEHKAKLIAVLSKINAARKQE